MQFLFTLIQSGQTYKQTHTQQSSFNNIDYYYYHKKSKITAVPTAFSLGGTIFGGSMKNSASTRKCCLQSCNFRFFPLGGNCLNQAE